MQTTTPEETLIRDYYSAFNAHEFDRMVSLLHPEVLHDINQGQRETGTEAFTVFLDRMNRCYQEEIRDIVVMTGANGRAAAEYTVHGTYLESDDDLPPATGQTYALAGGAFFEITEGRITRITNYYNLTDWLEQIDPVAPVLEVEE